MSNPNRVPEDREDRMPVRTPGLADALRRLAGNPSLAGPLRRPAARPPSHSSSASSFEGLEGRVRELYAVVLRQARLFAEVFVGVAVLLGLILAFQTPVFESTALLLVKVGRELIYNPQVGEQKAVSPSPRDKQTVINSELAIMRSDPVIASVVKSVGLTSLYPDLGEQLTAAVGDPEVDQVAAVLHAKAGERLRESLVVLALPEADVLQVSFRHPDGAVAQKAVSALIDRFTEAHLHAFGEPEVVHFLDDRVNAYRQSLETTEAELREFEVKHPVFADDAPQAALEKRIAEQQAQLDAIDAQISQVRLSAIGERSGLAQAQRDRLALEVESSQIKGHLRDNADRELAVVKDFIAARKGEIDAQIASLEHRRNQLQATLTESQNERAKLPALSSEYRDLRRERDANEEQYNTYQKRLRDARFSHEMDTEKIASLSVIQKATLAPEAIWPLPPALGGAVVVVLGVLIAALAATLADYYGWTWSQTWNRWNASPLVHQLREQARRR